MAVKILITLDGADQVKASLNDLQKSGEDFMKTISEPERSRAAAAFRVRLKAPRDKTLGAKIK
jgi:hypothetical protein